MTAPDHLNIRGRHFLEGRQGLLGLRLLDDPDNRVKGDNNHDGNGIDVLAQKQGHHRGDDQDDDQKIVELIQKQMKEARPLAFCEFIGTVLPQPGLGLGLAQPSLDMGFQLADDMIYGFAVKFPGVHENLSGCVLPLTGPSFQTDGQCARNPAICQHLKFWWTPLNDCERMTRRF